MLFLKGIFNYLCWLLSQLSSALDLELSYLDKQPDHRRYFQLPPLHSTLYFHLMTWAVLIVKEFPLNQQSLNIVELLVPSLIISKQLIFVVACIFIAWGIPSFYVSTLHQLSSEQLLCQTLQNWRSSGCQQVPSTVEEYFNYSIWQLARENYRL